MFEQQVGVGADLVNGVYQDISGPGTTVLLVHGTAADLWGEVPQALAQHRIISYARRGFDGSTGPTPTRFHQHTEDLAALLTELGATRCLVVGWSSGGILALDLALSHPDQVAGLVLIEPPLHVQRRPSLRLLRGPVAGAIRGRRNPKTGVELFFRWALRDTTGADPEAGLPSNWWAKINNSYGILAEIGLGTGEYLTRRSLGSLTCPTMVLTGDRSDPSFARAAARIATAVPNATLRTVAHSGHVMQAHNPSAIINAVHAIDISTPPPPAS